MTEKIDIESLIEFVSEGKYHLGVGGLGDLLLVLAKCRSYVDARIVFFATTGLSKVAAEFIKAFDIEHAYVVPNLPVVGVSRFMHHMCYRHKNLLAKPIHPVDLDYGIWAINLHKYVSRVVSESKFAEIFGTFDGDESIVVIAPRGSNGNKIIYPHEFNALCDKYQAEGYKVFGIGSESEMHEYATSGQNWLNSSFIRIDGSRLNSDVKTMFKALNTCEFIVSVDSWPKTYTCLAGIDTRVVMSRVGNAYMPPTDAGSNIFLNVKLWKTLTLTTVEKLISVPSGTSSRIRRPKALMQ